MLVVTAWRALSGRRKAVAGWVRKNPEATQIYTSLSGLRQTFDQPIVQIGKARASTPSTAGPSQYGL
jgi:hypothetical protein